MKVLLVEMDGKLPNIALMRLAAHWRGRGAEVEYRRCDAVGRVQRHLGDEFDRVYGSAIFTRTLPVVEAFQREWPGAIIGGTGSGSLRTLEQMGVGLAQDYSIYPAYRHSVGFTQRGCRLKCPFCTVPKLEGAVRSEQTVADIWRGEPWPRNLVLLDNDFFGQKGWRDRIAEIRDGGFRVSFNQGVNVRLIGEEEAAAIASVKYYDDEFKVRRIYTAWDNAKDEGRLFRGLELLKAAGVKPDQIMVYMLVGYWLGETHEERDWRRRKLREFGCRPYPMPYVRTKELIGFQRWVVRRADLMCTWDEYKAAGYRPEGVTNGEEGVSDLLGEECAA